MSWLLLLALVVGGCTAGRKGPVERPDHRSTRALAVSASDNIRLLGVAAGSSGTYVVGNVFGADAVAGREVRARGDADCFVAKIDDVGRAKWVRTAGGKGGYCNVRDVAAAKPAHSGVWIVGSYKGLGVRFGDLATGAKEGSFIARMDADGEFTALTGLAKPGLKALAVDGSGSVFAVGNSGTTDKPTPFVVKLDGTGRILWDKRLLSSLGSIATSVAADHRGHAFVAGSFRGVLACGPQRVTAADAGDAYVAEVDRHGSVVGCWKEGGFGLQIPEGVAVDRLGRVYLAGFFDCVSGGRRVFDVLVAFKSDGRRLWGLPHAKTISRKILGRGVLIDRSGAPVVYGNYDRRWRLGRAWMEPMGGSNLFAARVAPDGQVVATTIHGAVGMDTSPIGAVHSLTGGLMVLVKQQSSMRGVIGRFVGSRFWIREMTFGQARQD